MSYRGPEILDFRESWLREIAAYQEHVKANQLYAHINDDSSLKPAVVTQIRNQKPKVGMSTLQTRSNKVANIEREAVHEKPPQYIVNTYHAQLLKKENKTRSYSPNFKEHKPLTQPIGKEISPKEKRFTRVSRVKAAGKTKVKNATNNMRGRGGKSPKKRSKLMRDAREPKFDDKHAITNMNIIHRDATFQPTDIQADEILVALAPKTLTSPYHAKLVSAQIDPPKATTMMTSPKITLPEAHTILEGIHRSLNGMKHDVPVEAQLEKFHEVLHDSWKVSNRENIKDSSLHPMSFTSNSIAISNPGNSSIYSHMDNQSSQGKQGKQGKGDDSEPENDLLDMIDDQSTSSTDTEIEYKGHFYLTDDDDEEEEEPPSLESPCKESPSSSEPKLYYNPPSVLMPSLFPHVPPFLTFYSHVERGPPIPSDLQRVLKWKMTTVTPKIVRYVVSNTGLRLLKKSHDWMGTWDKHMKSTGFKEILPYQKYNHLPGSFKIGRKDSVWKNLKEKLILYGKKEFGFMRRTYILPEDMQQLKRSWLKYAQQKTKWILKPPASARGVGVRLISKWSEIPQGEVSTLIQKYIERPLLINGNKFDLRLYVLITSMDPLKIFLHHEGLARFASVQYSDKMETIHDRCMHLTNYSINKFSTNYVKNVDIHSCSGHKWTLTALWSYLEAQKINTKLIWGKIRDLVVRTVIVGESGISRVMRHSLSSKYCCYELFGFDVLLDENLTPWLLEVNISPSLHIELPLDQHVKGPLIQTVLNTACYQVPPKLTKPQQKDILAQYNLSSPLCYDRRLFVTALSNEETNKHQRFTDRSMEFRADYLNAILENLTPDDVRCLIIAEDELARSSPLERIFPGAHSHTFLQYFDTPRYYNRLLDAWEAKYSSKRDEGIKYLRKLCAKGVHLRVTASALYMPEFAGDSDDDEPHVD